MRSHQSDKWLALFVVWRSMLLILLSSFAILVPISFTVLWLIIAISTLIAFDTLYEVIRYKRGIQ